MRKNFKVLLIIIITLSVVITLSSCGPSNLEIHIFADMSECRAIGAKELTGVQITVYDSLVKDKYIGELAYVDYYACSYSSVDLQFDLFAYEFSNLETAQAYFKNATGQDTSKSVTFSDLQGATTYQRVVINNNLAYSVCAKASDADAVKEIINQFFSKKILDVEW